MLDLLPIGIKDENWYQEKDRLFTDPAWRLALSEPCSLDLSG
jgi:hypothetical protein